MTSADYDPANAVLAGHSIRQRHWAARVSLLSSMLVVLAIAVYVVFNPIASAAALACAAGALGAGWHAAGHRRHRVALMAAAILLLAAMVAVLLDSRRDAVLAAAVLVFAAASLVSARVALRHGVTERRDAVAVPVPAADHPVLLVNPHSGEGKAQRSGLLAAATARDVETIELGPGDDLEALAEQAVARGADVLGMAGGDGSQAVVASVAARHDLPMVCIASGTRNHFAADLGVDRHDVPAGLDAFGDALERRVDLGQIDEGDGRQRTFVNNVVLGVYGRAVQREQYRAAKGSTTMDVLQEFAGPEAFDLRFLGPDQAPHPQPDLVFVGNNPYRLASLAGLGTRPRLDAGHLGIVTVRIEHPNQLSELAALELVQRPHRFGGWTEWVASEFVVDSGAPIEAGIDGEAALLTPPVRFRVAPGAVRVRTARAPTRRLRVPPALRALTALARRPWRPKTRTS